MTSKLRKYGELTAQQLVAIEFLIVKRGSNMTYGEIAEVAGVSVKTLERWRKFPDFQNELRRRALETMGEALPQVLETLTGKALEGNNKSIELFLKALGILSGDYDINTRPVEEADRSNEALEADIAKLELELAEFEKHQIN